MPKKIKGKRIKPDIPEVYKGLSLDPDRLFDFVCFRNYVAGQIGVPIPADENEAAYRLIKYLIATFHS